MASVRMAPGKSSKVYLPFLSRKKPCTLPPVKQNPEISPGLLIGNQVSLPRHCSVYRAGPSNDGATTYVKGGTHREEDLMEIAKLSFPSKDGILGFLKGASSGVEPHTLRACLDHLPDHADRGFQTCHEGLFCLG